MFRLSVTMSRFGLVRRAGDQPIEEAWPKSSSVRLAPMIPHTWPVADIETGDQGLRYAWRACTRIPVVRPEPGLSASAGFCALERLDAASSRRPRRLRTTVVQRPLPRTGSRSQQDVGALVECERAHPAWTSANTRMRCGFNADSFKKAPHRALRDAVHDAASHRLVGDLLADDHWVIGRSLADGGSQAMAMMAQIMLGAELGRARRSSSASDRRVRDRDPRRARQPTLVPSAHRLQATPETAQRSRARRRRHRNAGSCAASQRHLECGVVWPRMRPSRARRSSSTPVSTHRRGANGIPRRPRNG